METQSPEKSFRRRASADNKKKRKGGEGGGRGDREEDEEGGEGTGEGRVSRVFSRSTNKSSRAIIFVLSKKTLADSDRCKGEKTFLSTKTR